MWLNYETFIALYCLILGKDVCRTCFDGFGCFLVDHVQMPQGFCISLHFDLFKKMTSSPSMGYSS